MCFLVNVLPLVRGFIAGYSSANPLVYRGVSGGCGQSRMVALVGLSEYLFEMHSK